MGMRKPLQELIFKMLSVVIGLIDLNVVQIGMVDLISNRENL